MRHTTGRFTFLLSIREPEEPNINIGSQQGFKMPIKIYKGCQTITLLFHGFKIICKYFSCQRDVAPLAILKETGFETT